MQFGTTYYGFINLTIHLETLYNNGFGVKAIKKCQNKETSTYQKSSMQLLTQVTLNITYYLGCI